MGMVNEGPMKPERGFTLVELLVAMGIGIIIMGAIYTTCVSQQKSYRITEAASALQQNVRAAMHFMESDIRMAGYDPKRSGNFGFAVIAADRITMSMDTANENGIVDTTETISYAYDSASKTLRRKAGAGAQVLAENITGLGFTYWTDSGTTTASLSGVRAVEISVTASEGGHERSLTTRVRCRNMGL